MPLYEPQIAGSEAAQVTATGTITTTSTTPVLATGMTITPSAGTYLVYFISGSYHTTIGAGAYVELSIYVGGAQEPASIVQCSDDPPYITPFCCVDIAVVNGSQAIEGRWCRTAGAGTASLLGTRTLTYVKIA